MRASTFAVFAIALLSACSKESGTTASGAVRVGFSQIGAESGWRAANTASIKAEAKKRGIDLVFLEAGGKQENQIRALRSFIQQRVDVIAFSPVVETGWQPVLEEIKQAGIPVVLTDRAVAVTDETLYRCFIGSDFVEEGRRAARWLADATKGQGVVVELQGTPGSAPAIDRKKGFEEVLAQHPGLKIVKSQSGDFTRAKGKEVMEAFLRSPEGPSITALYAHNDDMALGAIQAIQEAGRKPGTDLLVVSIDGVKDAFLAMKEGTLNCTVECNPLLGPQLFDVVEKLRKGETVARRIQTEEGMFTREQVTDAVLASRQY
jgi:ABC-type sugar transport system substrate-binding protein